MSPTTKTSSTSPADQPSSTSKNDQTDDVQITGEKRKAESSSTKTEADNDAGGKDLVETKQTTLDDVIQHEKKESESVPKPAKGKGDDEPATKKSKIDTEANDVDSKASQNEDKMEVDEGKEKELSKGAKTPPLQLSQTEESIDRPHKSVKRVDNLADKPITGTPTKSTIPNNVEADIASSFPLRASNGAGGSRTDGVKGAGTAEDEGGETVPGDQEHLDHPENWTTGDEPATEKQKGYLKVLESQKGVSLGDISEIGKSEASEKIDELVSGNANGALNTTTATTATPASAPTTAPDTTTEQPIKSTDGETTTNAASGVADAETVPGDEAHLDHPENWTTGGEPATDKQKGFLKVLEKQKGVEVGDVSSIGKSEASEKIDELKNM